MQIRFCGHAVSARELALIEGITESCTGLSRTELARTVCELLGWRRANGGLKSRECWTLLEQLEGAGALGAMKNVNGIIRLLASSASLP